MRDAGRIAQHLGQTTWVAAAIAGGFAGTFATALQLLLWWLSATDPLPRLLRDAQLTAALAMDRAILTSEPRWQWDVLFVAALIHYALSTVYAALAFRFLRRLRIATSLLAGGGYGILIYATNLHGFTLIFPWFSAARGWDTLLVHVVFGMAVTGACSALRSIGQRPGPTGRSGAK